MYEQGTRLENVAFLSRLRLVYISFPLPFSLYPSLSLARLTALFQIIAPSRESVKLSPLTRLRKRRFVSRLATERKRDGERKTEAHTITWAADRAEKVMFHLRLAVRLFVETLVRPHVQGHSAALTLETLLVPYL